MEPPSEAKDNFFTPRHLDPGEFNVPHPISPLRHPGNVNDVPSLPLQQTGDGTMNNAEMESLSSRVATSFARFGLSPMDSTKPPPPAFNLTTSHQHSPSQSGPDSLESAVTEDLHMRIFSTADLLQLPSLPAECRGKRLTSAEREQINSTYVYELWEVARRYLSLTPPQLTEVVTEARILVDPRLPSYPLFVAIMIFKGLTYVAGIKTPLLIKSFVLDHLRLAVTMNELDGETVDTYLRQYGTIQRNPTTDLHAYTSTRQLHAQANKANPRQEKNHTTATKMSRPRTITEYVSAHALLDWFVEVEAYLEFLDMTAIDQIDVVTSLFRGTIRKLWNHLSSPQKDAIITWPLIKKLMIAEFLPEDYISDFYEELRDIKQTSTVKEYNRKYYALIQDIPNLPPEMAYYHYVAGLKPKIHTFVKVLPSKTLQHAMRQAETFDEAFTESTTLFGSRKFTDPSYRWDKESNQPRRQNDSKGYDKKQSQTWTPKEVTCYNCQKKGHYANKCTQPKKSIQRASVQKVATDQRKRNVKDLKGEPPQ